VNNSAPAHHTAADYPPVPANYPTQELSYETADADDLDLLADSRFKPTKVTLALIALIAAAVAFGGGVLVQKHYGTSTPATAAGAFPGAGLRSGGAGGFSGEFGGFGGQAGGFGQAGAGQAGAGQAAAGPGASSASSTPVVVGTITKISGSTLTVKNFAGKSVQVTIPEGASITLIAGASLTSLKTGNSVSVAGTTNSDGSIKASTVTVTSS
jgi:Domain of unknown function (DUF5666)